jgi:two-component system, LytTR family, response regulator
MIRAIVVDDEKPSREAICNYLKEFCPDVKVAASASSVKTGFKLIKKYSPDVVFLDIEMADGKGFDLLKLFDRIDFKVIFVTAYSEYAIKAFRFNAIDYLLKPIKIDELQASVIRVKESKNDFGSYSEHLAALVKNLSDTDFQQQTITISHLKGFQVLRTNDIIMCKADGYCTVFHLINNRKTIGSKNLKQYEELLSGNSFLRVHHSYLINLHHVCGYSRQGDIVLTEGNRAYLSDTYKNEFIGRFIKK